MRRTISLLAATASAAVGLVAVPATSAVADEIAVPAVCQTFPHKTPGFDLRVGDTYVTVPSVDDVTVCVYQWMVAATGVPIPQFPTDCGPGCVYIQSSAIGVAFKPYVQVSYRADGQWVGVRHDLPPVDATLREEICFSVGDENRPRCPINSLVAFEQTL